MNTFKKTTLALAISALAGGAMAQSAPAPAPETSPITANVTLVNDYRFRGISQTNFKPAIQGGFDYAHESGFYIGNWNSTISWVGDLNPGMSTPLEMNFYGGFKKDLFAEGFATDIGVLQYYYPTSGPFTALVNPNTTEIYLAQNLTLGPVTGFVKFSYAVTNAFGWQNSSGSYYPDLTLNYDTGIWGLALNGHIGYQYIAGSVDGVSNNTNASFTDWKVGFSKDFGGGLSAAIAYVGSNSKLAGYASPQGKNLGRDGGLISLTKTF